MSEKGRVFESPLRDRIHQALAKSIAILGVVLIIAWLYEASVIVAAIFGLGSGALIGVAPFTLWMRVVRGDKDPLNPNLAFFIAAGALIWAGILAWRWQRDYWMVDDYWGMFGAGVGVVVGIGIGWLELEGPK